MWKLNLIVRVGLRVLLGALGCAAIVWGVSSFGNFWRSARVERAATNIATGEAYRPNETAGMFAATDAAEREGYCRPSTARAIAILRLEFAEKALLQGDRGHLDGYLKALEATAQKAIGCAPTDPFLWIALYRAKVLQEGFKTEDIAYLRASYTLGPNEGWIALKRNWLALAVYRQLPPDLAKAVLSEYAGILNMGSYQFAATVLEGPGWNVRDKLAASVTNVRERNRRALSNLLYHDGFDVVIPGIPRHDPRPWD